jgi:hypothetical protein
MESDINKQIFRKDLKDHDDTGYVEGTPEERIAIQWELTKMAWKLADPSVDAEQPLQRHVTNIIRPQE